MSRTRLLGFWLLSLCFAQAIAQETAPTVNAPASASTKSAENGPVNPGDAKAGETKAIACAACHGSDGNSADAQYPKLAGQHEPYIHRQLQLFKSGERENAIMMGFAATLSEQDMRDIGAFFAAKSVLPGVANDALVPNSEESWAARGQKLFRGGNPQTGLPACMSCHGPGGRGNPGARYPNIAGQHADYTKNKLLAFRTGAVWGKNDNANAIMADIAKKLDETDIEALSTYLEGLHVVDGNESGIKP